MLLSLLGGALIGLSASMLWFSNGRIAGISGVFAGLLGAPSSDETPWRAAFVLGLVLGGAVVLRLMPVANVATASAPVIAIAGVLVGVGTRLANGCTSGHGVCGNARLSKRSMVATLTFMGTGALTVFLVRHVLGGAS